MAYVSRFTACKTRAIDVQHTNMIALLASARATIMYVCARYKRVHTHMITLSASIRATFTRAIDAITRIICRPHGQQWLRLTRVHTHMITLSQRPHGRQLLTFRASRLARRALQMTKRRHSITRGVKLPRRSISRRNC